MVMHDRKRPERHPTLSESKPDLKRKQVAGMIVTGCMEITTSLKEPTGQDLVCYSFPFPECTVIYLNLSICDAGLYAG